MIKSRNEFLALLKEEAYKKGEFKLSSGRKSEHYVNCKPVTLQGDALMFISWCMFECIEDDCDAVGGLTLGADPLVAGVPIVAAIEERPMDGLIVRKEPKGHGTKAWIEGPELAPGKKVTVLEDVITTGGSAIKAAEKLRDAGYVVENVVAIINRQEGTEADDAMDAADLNLISLFMLEELI
jgi:orotate phosphoribosyltransferase